MPLPTRNIALLHHIKTVRQGHEKMRSLVRQLERRERAIRESDEPLTEEQRASRIQKAREELRAEYRRVREQTTAAARAAKEAARTERTHRKSDPGTQTRVRTLLERGLKPIQVLERAYELRDDEMVAALRTEMLWFGDGKGFADAQDVVTACDLALAEVGYGVEAENNAALIELDETLPKAEAVSRFAAKKVEGVATPHDRLVMAYATGAPREGGEPDADG